MIYAQLGKLYLVSKSKAEVADDDIYFRELPLTEGIGLEYEYTGSSRSSRIVIAFIYYDNKANSYTLEPVGDRLMEYLTPENLVDAKYLCKYAERILRDAYNRLHEEKD